MSRQLVRASAEQKAQRDVLTHAAWGARLTVPQFQERERRLRAQGWAARHMQTWLLVEDGVVLSSCESFRMPALNATRRGVVHAFASVFTGEHLRGRGHAVETLRRAMDAICALEPDVLAFTLYSDVGTAIYERAGFTAVPARDLCWGPLPGDPAEGVEALLHDHELVHAVHEPAEPGFHVVPDAAQLDWHVERERAYAELLGLVRPSFHGAVIRGSTAAWCGDLRNGELLILELHAHNPADANALIASARRVAHAAGLEGVRAWEIPGSPVAEGARVEVREDSLPMLRPMHVDVRADAWRRVPRSTWV